MTERISLFIITKNEEKKIGACIASAKDLVSEVIVVDSFSKDKTLQIAAQMGAQVFQRPFDGFAAQKNFALSKVSSPWALSLDADESLSPQLKEQIRTALKNTSYVGFKLPRMNSFLGKRMKHSGLNKEYHLRLVRKDKATYKGGLVHEYLQADGPIDELKAPFYHDSYETIEDYFHKFNKYTTLAAQQMYKNGRKFHLLAVLLTIPFEFLKRYVLKLGFLDGIRGFIWASFSSFYVFVKYIKLWYLYQKKPHHN